MAATNTVIQHSRDAICQSVKLSSTKGVTFKPTPSGKHQRSVSFPQSDADSKYRSVQFCTVHVKEFLNRLFSGSITDPDVSRQEEEHSQLHQVLKQYGNREELLVRLKALRPSRRHLIHGWKEEVVRYEKSDGLTRSNTGCVKTCSSRIDPNAVGQKSTQKSTAIEHNRVHPTPKIESDGISQTSSSQSYALLLMNDNSLPTTHHNPCRSGERPPWKHESRRHIELDHSHRLDSPSSDYSAHPVTCFSRPPPESINQPSFQERCVRNYQTMQFLTSVSPRMHAIPPPNCYPFQDKDADKPTK